MATQQVHGIVSGANSEIHDEPHIEGSRITVRYIQRRVEDVGEERQYDDECDEFHHEFSPPLP